MGASYMLQNVITPMKCALRKRGCDLLLATILRQPDLRLASNAFFIHIQHSQYSKYTIREANRQVKYMNWGFHYHEPRDRGDFKVDSGHLGWAMWALSYFDLVG